MIDGPSFSIAYICADQTLMSLLCGEFKVEKHRRVTHDENEDHVNQHQGSIMVLPVTEIILSND